MSDDSVTLEDNVPIPFSRVKREIHPSRVKYEKAMLSMDIGQSFVVDDPVALGSVGDPAKFRNPSGWACIQRLNRDRPDNKKWVARWVEKHKSIRVWRVS